MKKKRSNQNMKLSLISLKRGCEQGTLVQVPLNTCIDLTLFDNLSMVLLFFVAALYDVVPPLLAVVATLFCYSR